MEEAWGGVEREVGGALKPVKDLRAKEGMRVSELLREFSQVGGFTAKKLADALSIMKEMYESGAAVFLSFPACVIATGVRGIVKEMVKRGLVDAIVTTCGTLDHDLARVWRNYYQGSFALDDLELRERGVHRVGSVLVPQASYGGILERKLRPILKEICGRRKRLGTYELVWELGEKLEKERGKESSIIYWCWRRGVPMVVPGITDGAVGSQLWILWESNKDFVVDVMKDEHLLSEMAFSSKRAGALIVGGGVSKHHVIWWGQFKGGLDYAVYITTAVEWDGSLSGAPPREAVSWRKIKPKAKKIQVEGDATILLPLLFYALIDEAPKRPRKPE